MYGRQYSLILLLGNYPGQGLCRFRSGGAPGSKAAAALGFGGRTGCNEAIAVVDATDYGPIGARKAYHQHPPGALCRLEQISVCPLPVGKSKDGEDLVKLPLQEHNPHCRCICLFIPPLAQS